MKYTLIHSFIHSFTYSLIHDLQETVDWDKKSLVDFNAGKTQLVLFDRSNNTSSIDVKINGSVPEEKSSFKIIFLKSSTIRPSMEYCCHLWAGTPQAATPSCYLELLDKLPK